MSNQPCGVYTMHAAPIYFVQSRQHSVVHCYGWLLLLPLPLLVHSNVQLYKYCSFILLASFYFFLSLWCCFSPCIVYYDVWRIRNGQIWVHVHVHVCTFENQNRISIWFGQSGINPIVKIDPNEWINKPIRGPIIPMYKNIIYIA